MKKYLIAGAFIVLLTGPCYCWGFYAHRQINFYALFLLPPEMLVFYKPRADFLTEHAVDPDKRRYAVPYEAPRHYLDIDRYGNYPFNQLPREWKKAVERYSEDTLQAYGIVPWWIPVMLQRLTSAFTDKDGPRILKLSAEIGHYIADAHVPLHVSSNHNGQLSGQIGIHAFWESRLPELLAEKEWDFFIGKAEYIQNPSEFIWKRVLESASAADTVLSMEKELSCRFPGDQKYSFEARNGLIVRQYSSDYVNQYNILLKGMVERRMRQSIFAVASFWYTAWVNAGQPDLAGLVNRQFDASDRQDFDRLDQAWKNGQSKGRAHE